MQWHLPLSYELHKFTDNISYNFSCEWKCFSGKRFLNSGSVLTKPSRLEQNKSS